MGCKVSPCSERHKAFRDVSYPKMHYSHLARFSPGRGSCTEGGLSCGSVWWHQLLKQKPRSPVRPSGKAAEGAGGRPGNIKDFSCMNFSSVKRRSQLTVWQAQASFGTCITENNGVTCPQLSRQPAVKVYLHQWPLEQQLRVSYARESSLDICKATQVQLLLNRHTR